MIDWVNERILKMSKRKMIFLIIVALALVPFVYSYYNYSKIKVENNHAEQFSRDLIDVVDRKQDFNMKDVTRFNWDRMIVFSPYTSRDEMVKVIGEEWTTSSYLGYLLFERTFLGDYPLDDDSFNKIVFLDRDQIVLDVTFNRREVDLTEIEKQILDEDAIFTVDQPVLKQR